MKLDERIVEVKERMVSYRENCLLFVGGERHKDNETLTKREVIKMGFSLKRLFEDLELILDKDQKAAKTVRELAHEIETAKQDAEQYGQLK